MTDVPETGTINWYQRTYASFCYGCVMQSGTSFYWHLQILVSISGTSVMGIRTTAWRAFSVAAWPVSVELISCRTACVILLLAETRTFRQHTSLFASY